MNVVKRINRLALTLSETTGDDYDNAKKALYAALTPDIVLQLCREALSAKQEGFDEARAEAMKAAVFYEHASKSGEGYLVAKRIFEVMQSLQMQL